MKKQEYDPHSARWSMTNWPKLIPCVWGEAVYVHAPILKVVNTRKQLNQKLIAACERGRSRLARSLLIAGADPNAHEGEALRWAVQNGHAKAVEVLLAYGANPAVIDDGVMSWAAWEGYTGITRALRRAARTHPTFC